MAEPNYVGIAMGLDITDLKSGLTEAQSMIRTAGKEFDNAVAGMDDWKKSAEGLSAKLVQLDKVLDAQQRAYRGIKAELDEAKRKYGENSEQVRKLNDQLLDADTKVKKTEKSIRYYTKALDDLKNSTDDATDSTKNLNSAQNTTGKSSSLLGEGFTVLKGAIANLISSGLQNLVGMLKNVSQQTRELRKELSILDNAFVSSGHTSEDARKAYVELNSVFGDTGKTQEALLYLAELTTTEEELSEYTDILAGVYSKFGKKIPADALAEAINKTVNLGSVQGKLKDALEWTGYSVDELNTALAQANDESERSVIIREVLNGIYGEAGELYRETNKDLIDAQKSETEYQLALVELGTVMTPMITTITNATKVMVELVTGFVKWFKRNAPVVISLLAGIVVGILALNLSSIISTLSTSFTLLALKIATVNATLMANPIILIVSLITMLITYIGYLWFTSDDFRKKVTGVFEAIGGAFKKMWDTLFEGLMNIGDVFGDVVDKFVDLGSQIVNGIVDGMKDAIGDIGDAVSDVGDSIVDGFKDFFGIHSPSKLMKDKVGKMLGLGIKEGLTESLSDVNAGIRDFGDGVDVNGMRGAGSIVNNFTQTINAPKEPSRWELYHQTKNLLNYYGGA